MSHTFESRSNLTCLALGTEGTDNKKGTIEHLEVVKFVLTGIFTDDFIQK